MSISTGLVSGSSRSAGLWTCRRLPDDQRAGGERSARAVEDERLLARIREVHAVNYFAYGYRRMWKALRRRRERAALPRAAADAPARDCGRQATREAVAHDQARPERQAAAGSGRA